MGPWYKRVNALVESARECTTVDEVVEILGEPDAVEYGEDIQTGRKQLAELGSTLLGDERSQVLLKYVDPYRPRHRYCFGFVAGRLDLVERQTVAESNQDVV